MAIRPLKISWREWCLYKLGTRDYSAQEMRQAIVKRAAGSGQTVDPEPLVRQLMAEGAIDDERYVRSQISLHSGSLCRKGPRELKRMLLTRGGVAAELIDACLNETADHWFEAARRWGRKWMAAKGFSDEPPQQIPEKLYFGIKQKLYRQGFTTAQIEAALTGFSPRQEPPRPPQATAAAKWVRQRMADGKGPQDIRRFLQQKGMPPAEIQQQLDVPDEVWIENAGRERERRFGAQRPKTAREKRKQADFLQRRGFSFDHIKAVLG